jgi:hypothetical protein
VNFLKRPKNFGQIFTLYVQKRTTNYTFRYIYTHFLFMSPHF